MATHRPGPPDISKWDQENDPILQEQVVLLHQLLDGIISPQALEGFIIIAGRLVDEFGNHRTAELAQIFLTHTEAGKISLRASLEHMNQRVGGYHAYETRYPVTVDPPKPGFPMCKIIGLDTLVPCLYRILDSKKPIYGSAESLKDYIMRTGHLPPAPTYSEPVLREKPQLHWCAYDKWDDPETTRKALQILHAWGTDCRLRATLVTSVMKDAAYVPFSGQGNPEDSHLKFDRYYTEIIAQDHPQLPGGGVQIGVEGGPLVDVLEQWHDGLQRWEILWRGDSRYS